MAVASEVRVILVDDHPAFRDGVCRRLNRESGITVLAEAANGEAVLPLVERHNPDVVILDLEMPGKSGVQIIHELETEGLADRVLILSAYQDEDVVAAVINAGAAGYLSKREPLATVVEAVRGIASGQSGWLSRKIASIYMGRPRARRDLLAVLSGREREVVQLMAHGSSNSEIGEMLFISESTVKKHANNIFEKLGLSTRSQVIAWMWKNGLAQ